MRPIMVLPICGCCRASVCPDVVGRNGTRAFASGAAAWQLCGQPGDKVSVFALSPLRSLRYQGLRWRADGLALPPFVALAARNALAAEAATVRWQSGDGVVFTPPGVTVVWAG